MLAIALALSASHLLDGPDDVETATTVAQVADAASEDAAALSSRQWAATQVCGPHATPQWVGDKDIVCLRHQVNTAANTVQIAGVRP